MKPADTAPAAKPTKPTCAFCGFERTGGNVLSAAPELLAALKAMVEEFDEPEWSPSTRIAINCAKVAITKAEGRP